MGRKKHKGNKQVLKQINNPQYLRAIVRRGEFEGVFRGTVETINKLALGFEAAGYIVTKEVKL